MLWPLGNLNTSCRPPLFKKIPLLITLVLGDDYPPTSSSTARKILCKTDELSLRAVNIHKWQIWLKMKSPVLVIIY